MERKQEKFIKSDLLKKMVFLTGPRQVGKTWLAKNIMKDFKNSVYLNWDEIEDKKVIKNKEWHPNTELLILDEIHKMDGWKNYLKGLYDTKESNLKILVTGSARLETFRQSGDSLAGRFFRHRLNPFTLAEIKNSNENDLNKLIQQGGFPEPFLANKTNANRWRLQYIDGLIRSDILDFEKIHDFKSIQLVFELLRKKVGSPISYKSIAEDVQIAPNTVKKYIQIFEALYIIFRVVPFSKNIARGLQKEPKIYFYDNGLVLGDEGIKFENLIATGLLKHQNALEDQEGIKTSLNYLRTKEKKEVDFCLVENNKIIKMIEVKLSEDKPTSNLFYFYKKYNIPALQLVKNLRTQKKIEGIEIIKAFNFLKSLRI
jgi:hypothetical protein